MSRKRICLCCKKPIPAGMRKDFCSGLPLACDTESSIPNAKQPAMAADKCERFIVAPRMPVGDNSWTEPVTPVAGRHGTSHALCESLTPLRDPDRTM